MTELVEILKVWNGCRKFSYALRIRRNGPTQTSVSISFFC
jgi:hypothetical protein